MGTMHRLGRLRVFRRLAFQIVTFEGNRTMPPWLSVFSFMEVLSLPILAALSLGVSKMTIGATAQAARRWFFGVLVAVTLITCRTVITLDPCWLTHTTTLSRNL
jgi:predicted ABC-type sugar transport system permease subunit